MTRNALLLLLISCGSYANGIDPTEPPAWAEPAAAPAATAATGQLQSILISGNNKLAVIGGKQYRQGDRWGDQRIRQIRSDRVILSSGRELRLFPQISVLTQE